MYTKLFLILVALVATMSCQNQVVELPKTTCKILNNELNYAKIQTGYIESNYAVVKIRRNGHPMSEGGYFQDYGFVLTAKHPFSKENLNAGDTISFKLHDGKTRYIHSWDPITNLRIDGRQLKGDRDIIICLFQEEPTGFYKPVEDTAFFSKYYVQKGIPTSDSIIDMLTREKYPISHVTKDPNESYYSVVINCQAYPGQSGRPFVWSGEDFNLVCILSSRQITTLDNEGELSNIYTTTLVPATGFIEP